MWSCWKRRQKVFERVQPNKNVKLLQKKSYQCHYNRCLKTGVFKEVSNNKEWFIGKDVCMLWGFKDSNDPFNTMVNKEHRTY